jgi:hypothetical protein
MWMNILKNIKILNTCQAPAGQFQTVHFNETGEKFFSPVNDGPCNSYVKKAPDGKWP